MQKAVTLKERRATGRKVVVYLILINFLGAFGIFLVGAVVRSHY
jgi:hypothetical protein